MKEDEKQMNPQQKKPQTPDEMQRERQARQWTDQIPDEDAPEPLERETYRDGTLISECWGERDN